LRRSSKLAAVRGQECRKTEESAAAGASNNGRALGICTLSSYFYWAVVERNSASPILMDRRREPVPGTMNTSQLMTWYSARVSSLLDSHMPTVVAIRLPVQSRGFPLSVSFMEKAIFPNAVVHLLCQQKEPPIPVLDYTKQSFTAKRFGLTKPADKTNTDLLVEECDSKFTHEGPYWDEYQKEAVLAAWLALRS